VRTRREVEGISKTSDGSFEISISHWEPREYANADSSSPLDWISGLFKKKKGDDHGALGRYYGGEAEGGPWEKFPALVKAEQKVGVEEMKVGRKPCTVHPDLTKSLAGLCLASRS